MFSKAFVYIGLLVLILLPLSGRAAEPSGPSAPVRLEIVSATATSRLACQLVLAHFVTQDIASIPAGGEAVIVLDRDLDDGTLIYRHDGGRRMAVENILCGVAANWRATRADLNLAALRAGRRANLRIICEAPKALSCTAVGMAE
ncbi:MAG: hypothetical protein O3B21_06215 [Proteobacteria bacterium]|nr:hypothetical protein [Pseudomonadota bacterium]MDA1356784.1 hypothetical protein [Pseudomonadota bacterium]